MVSSETNSKGRNLQGKERTFPAYEQDIGLTHLIFKTFKINLNYILSSYLVRIFTLIKNPNLVFFHVT